MITHYISHTHIYIFIHVYVEYCSHIFNDASQYHMRVLDLIKRRALKLIEDRNLCNPQSFDHRPQSPRQVSSIGTFTIIAQTLLQSLTSVITLKNQRAASPNLFCIQLRQADQVPYSYIIHSFGVWLNGGTHFLLMLLLNGILQEKYIKNYNSHIPSFHSPGNCQPLCLQLY